MPDALGGWDRARKSATPALRRVWSWRGFAGLVCAASCAIALAACFLRGPSLDEFATELYADPAIPLAKAWFELWPTETNPPLFYLIARWGVEILGDPLYARRLINAAPLLGLTAWFVAAARGRPERQGFLAAYAILDRLRKDLSHHASLLSQLFLAVRSRSRLLRRRGARVARRAPLGRSGCSGGAAVPHLAPPSHGALRDRHRDCLLSGQPRDAPVGGARDRDVVRRRVSRSPVAAFSALQLDHHEQVLGEVGWIPRLGALASLAEIGAVLPGAMAQNWAAVGCAALALAAASRPRGRRAAAIALLLGSATAATTLVFAINIIKPIVVQRYFSFVFVEFACA